MTTLKVRIQLSAFLGSAAILLGAVSAIGQTTQPILPGDVLFAASKPNPAQATQHVRGNTGVANAGMTLGSTWQRAFIQSIEFDHTDGIRHNNTGNALGLDFGTLTTGGGVLYNMQTNRVANDPNPGVAQRIFNIGDYNTSTGSSILTSRLGSIVVSPLNNRIAVTGNDSGEVYVADYAKGPTPGAGASASVSNVREGGNLIAGGSQTHGAVWFDNDNVLAVGHNGEIHKLTVAGANLNDSVVTNIAFPSANLFSSMLYEPNLSPNVYVMYSFFDAGTQLSTSRLVVLNPSNNFASVGSFDYSGSSNTSREIAFDANGNLLIGEFSQPFNSPAIETVVGGNILANLASNNSQNYYTLSNSTGTSSFNGLDVASNMLDYKTAGLTANVRNKSLMVRYFPGTVDDPTTAIRTRLLAGRNGGSWDGTGSAIISSDAAAANPKNTAIGYAQASQLGLIGGTWAGLPVDGPAILLKYTYYGDTDLNGVVNFDDYSRTDNGFNTGGTTWFTGDFDYNGQVNFDDYSLIDSAFNTQSGSLRRAMSYLDGSDRNQGDMNTPALQYVVEHFDQFGQPYANSFLNAVPEPATLGAFGLIAAAALARRRRI